MTHQVPPPPRRVTPTRRGVGRAADGSLSLEFALALPLVAFVAFALLQIVGVARDALLAQDLARLGARIAATSSSDHAVHTAVANGAGPGVTTEVTVTPPVRHRGDTIVVEVTVRRPRRPLDLPVTGRAATHGEPVLDR